MDTKVDEASTNKLQRWVLTMNNKIKIPVERLKEIIQEEVSKFYDLPKKKKRKIIEEDDMDEAIITGSTESDKQAAIQSLTTALKDASPDKAVSTAASAGIPVSVKAVR